MKEKVLFVDNKAGAREAIREILSMPGICLFESP
jgi:hypothetical protein